MRVPTLSISLLRAPRHGNGRAFSAAASAAPLPVVDSNPVDWESARPYTAIPGPSRWEFVRLFAPGGQLAAASALDIQQYLRGRYGSLVRLPGMLGKRDLLFSFDPSHFELVYRTEGVWPLRRNMDTFSHYRRNVCPAVFKGMGGLVEDHGPAWLKLRQAANPVMLLAKTANEYIPGLDRVAQEFVGRVGELRDGGGEMPADFMNELGLWATESAGVIALDRRFGVMEATRSAEAVQLIGAIRNFFRLLVELEVKPSIWRYYESKNFRDMMATLDVLTQIISGFIEETTVEMEQMERQQCAVQRNGVLQKMYKINPHYAFLITFDMILAGIDSSASVMATFLHRMAVNPEKQAKLRAEIVHLLPHKDSAITASNYQEFAYFRACLKESMRMQPQVPTTFRGTGQNIVLDDYRIPKGTDVTMAQHILQTSDEHFHNSREFLPERWLRNSPEHESDRHPFVFLPFGFGPRKCVGKRFGEMELQLLATRLLREYRVEWHYPDIEYVNALVQTPKSPLRFKMIPL